MNEEWEFPIKDWDKLDKEHLLFILNCGIKHFESVSKVSSNIITRSYTLLAIIISFFSLLASFNYHDNFLLNDCAYSYLWLPILFIAFILLIVNILPHDMMHHGYEPKKINYKDFFNYPKPKSISNALIIDQIEDVQNKIEFTNKSNKFRLKFLLFGIILTFISVLYLVIISLIA
jgi:hypothetical protein